jgi:hypothetical protein
MPDPQPTASIAGDQRFTAETGFTGPPDDRPAWAAPLLTPLLLNNTQAGGTVVGDGTALADLGVSA